MKKFVISWRSPIICDFSRYKSVFGIDTMRHLTWSHISRVTENLNDEGKNHAQKSDFLVYLRRWFLVSCERLLYKQNIVFSMETKWNVAYVRRRRKSSEFNIWSYVWNQWYINYLLDIQTKYSSIVAHGVFFCFFSKFVSHEYIHINESVCIRKNLIHLNWKWLYKWQYLTRVLKVDAYIYISSSMKSNWNQANERLVNIQYPLKQWQFFFLKYLKKKKKIQLFSVYSFLMMGFTT